MRKFFLSILICFFIVTSVSANEINKRVKEMSLGMGSTFSAYVVDFDTKKVLYKKNEDKYLNTASIIKPLTFGAVYKVLGNNYEFKTSLYIDGNNDIYIKLGGDVLLSQSDLNNLLSNLKNLKFNKIYIDDTIFVYEQYPSVWLDEDKWPNQRMISPYIVDSNYTDIAINRSSLAKKVDIIQNNDYKIPFINELKIGDKQDINILRLYGENSHIVNLQGTVKEDEIIKIPLLKPEINFNIKVNKALEKNKILYQNVIFSKQMPNNAKEIAFVSHNIKDVSKSILYNSDNFASEVVFRVAASKYYNKSATLDDSIKMFREIYKEYLTDEDVLADGSGVSRQNLFCSETIAKILTKLFEDEEFRNLLATSNQGTLSERLIFLKDNLRAKTGTMKYFSSLCGIFNTRKNRQVVFVFITQDSNQRKALLKNFENTLVGTIYKKY